MDIILEQKKKEAIAHNVSESQSILIHDLASRMFDAGVEAMRELSKPSETNEELQQVKSLLKEAIETIEYNVLTIDMDRAKELVNKVKERK